MLNEERSTFFYLLVSLICWSTSTGFLPFCNHSYSWIHVLLCLYFMVYIILDHIYWYIDRNRYSNIYITLTYFITYSCISHNNLKLHLYIIIISHITLIIFILTYLKHLPIILLVSMTKQSFHDHECTGVVECKGRRDPVPQQVEPGQCCATHQHTGSGTSR